MLSRQTIRTILFAIGVLISLGLFVMALANDVFGHGRVGSLSGILLLCLGWMSPIAARVDWNTGAGLLGVTVHLAWYMNLVTVAVVPLSMAARRVPDARLSIALRFAQLGFSMMVIACVLGPWLTLGHWSYLANEGGEFTTPDSVLSGYWFWVASHVALHVTAALNSFLSLSPIQAPAHASQQ